MLGRPPLALGVQGQIAGQLGGGMSAGPSGGMMPARQATVNPLNDYKTDEQGNLYRGSIPVDEKQVKDPSESFQNPTQSHKPLTTGQRLLQGITPTIASGIPHPSGRAASLAASQAINNRQNDSARIQQLTQILTNPPKHNAGRAGIVSDYNHDQLQSMADELDKLLGE